MAAAGVDPAAIEVFAHYYRLLEHGETGMIPEAAIEPLDMDNIADVEVSADDAAAAIRTTAVIKLNGGLGTSMGMDRAKSLLCVRSGLSFLDIIARQVLYLRRAYDAPLPLIFMNSFRTSTDTMAALARYEDLPVAGFTSVFVSNSDNLGAVPDARVAGWFATSGAPFAIEAVRRTPSDKKGGHFARRKSDGRIVLRETAQTLPADQKALADLGRHRYASTNNLWFDIAAMQETVRARQGVLGLPLIRNVKHVDPSDPSTPEVIQIETAMGAAIEVFEGAQTIEVGRDRFVPVKTTNDLLLLRSDVYDLGKDFVMDQVAPQLPYVDLDDAFYKLVGEFDKRFPDGAPSLREASSFEVEGDWTFGSGVKVVGEVALEHPTGAQRIAPGTVLSDD
jgi:UTP--glucose-1-phosphate uridylyltransferase